MKLQTRTREAPEVNLTSLIDVVLLLLVFFMVSTSFVREAEINVNLPEADAEAQLQTEVEKLEIGITQTGAYSVNGRLLTNNERRTLRAAIEETVGDARNMPVSIRADAQSPHQAFVTAMEVAGQLGFSGVSIATVSVAED